MWTSLTKKFRLSESHTHEREDKMVALFSKKAKKKLPRIFFATDLHASERVYRKFINAAKFYDANVLVMGGDVLGKIVVPVIKERNGRYRAMVQGQSEEVETAAELEHLLARIGAQGAYSKVMSVEEFQALQSDPSARDSLFHELARQRLSDWVDFAETRLKGTGVKCFMTGGNDDFVDTLEPLQREDLQSVIACEGQEVRITDQHTMISLGLHGHIHESRGTIKLGRSLCVNPGSEYGEGVLRGALITLNDDKIESCQLTSG